VANMSGIECVFIMAIAVIVVTFLAQRTVLQKALFDGFNITRRCIISDGIVIYEVEITNELPFDVNSVTVTLDAYPKNYMEFTGQEKKTIRIIEPGESEKLEFRFTPTKAYVDGQIQSSVSYIDDSGELRTIHIESYDVQSVCDLLNPREIPVQQFDTLLSKMDAISENILLEAQTEVLFERAQILLPTKNFFIIDTEMYADDVQFTGIVRAYAEGKYIQKKIGIILTVTRTLNIDYIVVKVQAHGDDLIMLHTAINEIASEFKMNN
jgi:hypothetical protein